jgi:hypothetical protein
MGTGVALSTQPPENLSRFNPDEIGIESVFGLDALAFVR